MENKNDLERALSVSLYLSNPDPLSSIVSDEAYTTHFLLHPFTDWNGTPPLRDKGKWTKINSKYPCSLRHFTESFAKLTKVRGASRVCAYTNQPTAHCLSDRSTLTLLFVMSTLVVIRKQPLGITDDYGHYINWVITRLLCFWKKRTRCTQNVENIQWRTKESLKFFFLFFFFVFVILCFMYLLINLLGY